MSTDGLSVIAWVFTALLLLLALFCGWAGRGRIGVNHLVGIRIPPLMRSEEAWRAGHAAGVIPAAIACGVVLAFTAIGLAYPLAYWGSLFAFVGGLVWVCLTAVKAANLS